MRQLSPERIDRLKHISRESRKPVPASTEAVADAPFIVEAMFLMAAADGHITTEEIQRFADSVTTILGDVSESDLEGMLSEMNSALVEEGWERRARAVGRALKGTPGAEIAFRLATAVAFVDDSVTAEESVAFDEMATAMEIPSDRAHEIMSDVHRQLFG
jgi:tellurite resistance protein